LALIVKLSFEQTATEEPVVLPAEAMEDDESALLKIGQAVGPTMDAPTAMAFLFDFDPEEEVAAYQRENLLSAVAFSASYSEAGHPHFVVVIQPAFSVESCHGCAVVLGVAVFAQVDGLWRLKRFNPAITRTGSYGRAPEQMALVKIGPDRHGVAVTHRVMGQGQTIVSYLLLGPVGDQWEEILSPMVIGDDVLGACNDNDPSQLRCYAWKSEIGYVPGANGEYFDMEVTSTGTVNQKQDAVAPLLRKSLFGFNGCRYVEGPAVPVSEARPYYAQVAAFESFQSAADLDQRLRATRFSSYCEYYTPASGVALFRVRIGDFASAQEARMALDRARGLGLDGYVKRR
jgi:hypothetical protein